jgi:ArsR family transcriptional regulator
MKKGITTESDFFIEAEKIEKISNVLKVIAHPIRLKVVEALQDERKLTVSRLADYVEAEQSLVSHHLNKMKDKGILLAKREGKNIYYQLADQKITKVFDCIGNCDFL